MKKVYSKPEILFEDFTVTANIAVGCEAITNSQVNVCFKAKLPMEGFGFIELFQEEHGCQVTPAGINDSLCYHTPDGFNTFNS